MTDAARMRVGSVVFDVADLRRGIAFWTAALGYTADPIEEDPPTFCVCGSFD